MQLLRMGIFFLVIGFVTQYSYAAGVTFSGPNEAKEFFLPLVARLKSP